MRAGIRLACFAAVFAAIALTLLALETGTPGQTFARVVAAVLAVMVSADELGGMLSFFGATRAAEQTTERLAHTE